MTEDMQIGAYRLDVFANRLAGPDGDIDLSPVGARFLEILARRPGEVVDRQAIIDEIWRGDFLTGDPALHRVVSEIRRAVGDNPREPMLIQTVHRRGYRLVVQDEPAAAVGSAPKAPSLQRSVGRGLRTFIIVWIAVLITIIFLTVGAKLVIEELARLRYS